MIHFLSNTLQNVELRTNQHREKERPRIIGREGHHKWNLNEIQFCFFYSHRCDVEFNRLVWGATCRRGLRLALILTQKAPC